jgi:hypothetical protein
MRSSYLWLQQYLPDGLPTRLPTEFRDAAGWISCFGGFRGGWFATRMVFPFVRSLQLMNNGYPMAAAKLGERPSARTAR